MLIVNDAHLCLAGRSSLEERCHYCKKPLAAYPLVMSDDAKQTVHYVTCALELATDLLVDLATFFHPPTLYQLLYVPTSVERATRRTLVARKPSGSLGQRQTPGRKKIALGMDE